MRESELRELAGLRPELEIDFQGQSWALRKDGLAPLIRYSRAGQSDNPERGVPLSAMYRLLEDTVKDFALFEDAAFTGKATGEEIGEAIGQLVAAYCARKMWPAMRLIAFVATNLEELDGRLIKAGGRGVASLTPREACNYALAVLLENREEDDREMFLMDLEYEGDPASEALAQLREFQKMKAEAQPSGE